MSYGYFESGTFSIYEDEAENSTAPLPGKVLRDENQARGLQVKRTVLGNVINGNQNTRVQPFRAAKQNHGYTDFEGNNKILENSASLRPGNRSNSENYVPLISKPQAPVITSQPFSIYCDENDAPSCIESSVNKTAAKVANSLYSAWNLQPNVTAVSSLAAETTKLRKPLSVLSTSCVKNDDESNLSCK